MTLLILTGCTSEDRVQEWREHGLQAIQACESRGFHYETHYWRPDLKEAPSWYASCVSDSPYRHLETRLP